MSRPTIRDVAFTAGVSHQTVSRVINGHDSVSDETRDRVLAVIRELDYVPSPMARGLIRNRTHSLGMVTADISDFFFAQAVAGAELETRRRGLYLMVGSVEEDAREDGRAYLRLMLERRVEGLILARPSIPLTTGLLQPALRASVPLVAVGTSEAPGVAAVDIDNHAGGREATLHLLALGHRRVATITGPLEWPSARARLAGFDDALRSSGVRGDPALVVSCADWGLEAGRAAAAELLRRDVPFTAIFAHSDLAAIGAVRELRAHGRSVPGDVSVVGYDDIPVAAFVDPPLTTVKQPMREVGMAAVELVLDAIAGRDGRSGVRLLPATLVVRESSAAPSGRA